MCKCVFASVLKSTQRTLSSIVRCEVGIALETEHAHHKITFKSSFNESTIVHNAQRKCYMARNVLVERLK